MYKKYHLATWQLFFQLTKKWICNNEVTIRNPNASWPLDAYIQY